MVQTSGGDYLHKNSSFAEIHNYG